MLRFTNGRYYWESLTILKNFSEFKKLQLKIRGLRAKKCYFSYYYDFERNYDLLMSCQRVHAFCWTKINFNKNKTKSKIKNAHTILERRNLCFSSYKNCKLKIKLWWVGACERKKGIFCTVYFGQRKFF